jgi:hypothetical protein
MVANHAAIGADADDRASRFHELCRGMFKILNSPCLQVV